MYAHARATGRPQLIVIGSVPTAADIEAKSVFTGRSGEIIENVIGDHPAFFTYAIKMRHTDGAPLSQQIRRWSLILSREIGAGECRDLPIIACGKQASDALRLIDRHHFRVACPRWILRNPSKQTGWEARIRAQLTLWGLK